MSQKPQALNIDRVRLSGTWTAWWAMFSTVVVGVWYLRGAKEAGEQVVKEVQELRSEMKQAREAMHILDVRVSTLEEWKRSKTSTGKGWGE